MSLEQFMAIVNYFEIDLVYLQQERPIDKTKIWDYFFNNDEGICPLCSVSTINRYTFIPKRLIFGLSNQNITNKFMVPLCQTCIVNTDKINILDYIIMVDTSSPKIMELFKEFYYNCCLYTEIGIPISNNRFLFAQYGYNRGSKFELVMIFAYISKFTLTVNIKKIFQIDILRIKSLLIFVELLIYLLEINVIDIDYIDLLYTDYYKIEASEYYLFDEKIDKIIKKIYLISVSLHLFYSIIHLPFKHNKLRNIMNFVNGASYEYILNQLKSGNIEYFMNIES